MDAHQVCVGIGMLSLDHHRFPRNGMRSRVVEKRVETPAICAAKVRGGRKDGGGGCSVGMVGSRRELLGSGDPLELLVGARRSLNGLLRAATPVTIRFAVSVVLLCRRERPRQGQRRQRCALQFQCISRARVRAPREYQMLEVTRPDECKPRRVGAATNMKTVQCLRRLRGTTEGEGTHRAIALRTTTPVTAYGTIPRWCILAFYVLCEVNLSQNHSSTTCASPLFLRILHPCQSPPHDGTTGRHSSEAPIPHHGIRIPCPSRLRRGA
jgi:hypothetical protein